MAVGRALAGCDPAAGHPPLLPGTGPSRRRVDVVSCYSLKSSVKKAQENTNYINMTTPCSGTEQAVRILLTNDDGYQAEGLRTLHEHLARCAEVEVLAPDRNRSGVSNSLTLRRPIQLFQQTPGIMYTDGTPTDCVHIGLTRVLEKSPHMVLSGINAGGNLGDDVLYSGTVAAAMEGRHLGYTAIAISCVGDPPEHYETAAVVARKLMQHVYSRSLPRHTILNVNVPDVRLAELTGYRVTCLGHRHQAEGVTRSRGENGEDLFWLGPAGAEMEDGSGTDFEAIRDKAVSITPLTTDPTRFQALHDVEEWLGRMA